LKTFKEKVLASTGNRTTNPRSPNPWLRYYYIDYAIASSLLKHRECNNVEVGGRGMRVQLQLHCTAYCEQNVERVESPAYRSTFVSLPAPSYSSSHEFVFARKAPRTYRTSCTNSLLSHRFHSTSFYSCVNEVCDNLFGLEAAQYVCTRQLFAVTEYW
jgi:hypothetical protein